MSKAIGDAVAALLYTGIAYFAVVRHLWPWDFRGRRREVVIKRGRRPFE